MVKTKPLLMETVCEDKKENIRITNYTDTAVGDAEGNLIAIRFGGYPEAVQSMSDSILGGCKLTLTMPDGESGVMLSSKNRKNYVRKLSHDGHYAESFHYLMDDELRSLSIGDDSGGQETVHAKRNLYIFGQNDDNLFCELDRKLAVPLIPKFKDYFIGELKSRGILKSLRVISFNQDFKGWHLNVSEDEKEIIAILEDGLRSGAISVPGGVTGMDGVFGNINNFTGYLKEFGTKIADRIKETFTPLFDPAKDPLCSELHSVNHFIETHAGYSLFDAQMGAAEALKRRLDQSKLTLLVAECGTGKTKIGSAALYAHQAKTDKKSFNAVICPSHITDKWVRELHESIPNCYARVVTSMADIDKLHRIYEQDNKTVYCILSKEIARNGYMKAPAVVWKSRHRYSQEGFACPCCGGIQEMTVFDDAGSYTVPADQFFFMNENGKNHKCQFCKEPLWTALNPDILDAERTQWVRIGSYGFVHRKFAWQHRLKCKNESILEKIKEIDENPQGVFPAVGAFRRYPLSSYIKQKIKRLDAVIIDELHEYSGESAQGEAMAELAGISRKTIGMTATLINGYSKGAFYLLYRLKPHLMQLDNQSYANSRGFCEEYGVIEKVYQVDGDVYNASSKNQRRKLREKFLPGVSPLVYSRFLLENTVFLSLSDMGKELPDYEEFPIPCDMRDDVSKEYGFLESELKKVLKFDKKIANKILSRYLNLLSAYPDQPYNQEPVIHPQTKEPIIVPKNLTDINAVLDKDEKVLALVERKVKNKERVIIYTAWTRLDTRMKLHKMLTEKGYRVNILDVNVPPRKRESWVDDRVREGIDVLIVNPTLVQTGLDLNAFTTLVFYNVAYNLYIFRQASRRSWRINQTAPRVEVYMFFYKYTMQNRALSLMASKLMAATVIEGNISEEGLAAMSDCQDLTTQLAKELMKGIKNDVDDLAESFKKMAILNNREEKKPKATPTVIDFVQPLHEVKQEIETPVYAEKSAVLHAEPISPDISDAPVNESLSVLLSMTNAKKRRKKTLDNFKETGQLDLLELFAS